MKICTIGNGFVAEHLNYEKINVRLDIDLKQINNVLDQYKPDVLINCIGKTGRPNIDWCENNKEITTSTNTILPVLLAEACVQKKIHLIHIGSGCIFFGKSPNIESWCNLDESSTPYEVDCGWKEDDFANPKSHYSKTKYACDLLLGNMEGITTLRIRMPISTLNSPRNLINKLRGYSQIIDLPNSVTFMNDLVRCIDWVAKERPSGIFHVTNPRPLTAAQIMREYKKYVHTHQFKIISEEELDKLTMAKRSNCILDTRKLNKAGFHMSYSEEALERCMKAYIQNI
jgi:3,5-epimerase/4-reductase